MTCGALVTRAGDGEIRNGPHADIGYLWPMNGSRVLDEFDRLVREANALEGDPDALNQLSHEPVFDAALKLVLANPEMREEFVGRFSAMLMNDDLELFEYCMHELRWPEVKSQLQAAVRNAASPPRDVRSEFYLEGVLRAFGDNWSGRGFYKRYGG